MAGMPGPPLKERAQLAIACSSGRIVCNRLTTAPGPDPVPPAAHLRASTVRAGHPVEASTADCGRRLGGGPARDGTLHVPRNCRRTDRGHAAAPHRLASIDSAQKQSAPSTPGVRAFLVAPRPLTSSGALYMLKTGSNSVIGPKQRRGQNKVAFRSAKVVHLFARMPRTQMNTGNSAVVRTKSPFAPRKLCVCSTKSHADAR